MCSSDLPQSWKNILLITAVSRADPPWLQFVSLNVSRSIDVCVWILVWDTPRWRGNGALSVTAGTGPHPTLLSKGWFHPSCLEGDVFHSYRMNTRVRYFLIAFAKCQISLFKLRMAIIYLKSFCKKARHVPHQGSYGHCILSLKNRADVPGLHSSLDLKYYTFAQVKYHPFSVCYNWSRRLDKSWLGLRQPEDV